MDKDELINFFALAQSLPGSVAANVSMFIGYKLRGKLGALCAVLGIIFVPFWIIVLLASVLSAFVDNHILQGALWGIGIAVIALILLTVKEMWENSHKDLFFYTIFFLSLIILLVFRLSPISTILFCSCIGIIFKTVQRKSEEKHKKGGAEK